MGRHTYYQAMPVQLPLFERLRDERGFHALFTELMLLGPGPFSFAAIDPTEIAGTLDWLAEHEPAFGSRADVDRALGELLGELGRASACHPGLEDRAAYFEKVHDEVQERLSSELNRRGIGSADDLVLTLLKGGALLAPDECEGPGTQLRWVPPALVEEGARALDGSEPGILWPDEADWDLHPVEDFDLWRRVYREAAVLGEAVIVLNA